MDEAIEKLAEEKYPECQALTAIDGVGTLTALAFVLTLEDPRRFKRSRQVGAYLGLQPAKRQSGACNPQLRITKAGDEYLRRLMVTSANHILRTRGNESDLRSWGLALAARGGKAARQRAKVAVARKLSVLMHRLWLTGEEYKPVGYRKLQAAA
jgi:transposase